MPLQLCYFSVLDLQVLCILSSSNDFYHYGLLLFVYLYPHSGRNSAMRISLRLEKRSSFISPSQKSINCSVGTRFNSERFISKTSIFMQRFPKLPKTGRAVLIFSNLDHLAHCVTIFHLVAKAF